MARRLDFYTATPEAEHRLSALMADEVVPSGIKDFLTNLIICWQQNNRQPISRSTLQAFLESLKKGSHASYLSLRQKELELIGVLNAAPSRHDDKPIRLITIDKLDRLFAHYRNSSSAKKHVLKRASRSQITIDLNSAEEIGSFLPASYDLQGRVEGLFTGILDSAVRLSGNDKRTLISCTYKISENDKIQITTKTLSNSEIMQLSDQRVIRALNACFIDYVETTFGPIDRITQEQAQRIDGLFFFDLYDLCNRIDLQPSPRNREIVRKMLERLRDTAFEIDASESPYFRDTYGRGGDSIQYRYITEFYAKKQHELVDATGGVYKHADRFYFVKFHSMLVAQLLTKGRSFIAHPALTKERRGIAHRLNNWCKARIGVRAKPGDNTYRYLMDEFWGLVMPSARLDNFCRDLLSLLQKNKQEGRVEESEHRFASLIYGYYFEVSTDPVEITDLMRQKRKRYRPGAKNYPVLKITRDTNDLYIGDNSLHNQALRRLTMDIGADA